MVIIFRSIVALAMSCVVVACSTAPSSPYGEEQSADTRSLHIKEHNLTLQLPKRWTVKSIKHQRESMNEIRFRFQDRDNRNAHGVMWILNNPGNSSNVETWALKTVHNMANWYNYVSNITQKKWYSLNIDGHYIYGWRTQVTVLGNFRDTVLLYAQREARGPDKWLLVAMRNEGAYRKLDSEKDVRDIATPIFTSFLAGAQDGT